MQIRTVLLAIAATSALSSAAFAAVNHTGPGDKSEVGRPSSRSEMTDRCSTLESQYDGVIGGQANAPNIASAEHLHSIGVDACDANQRSLGVQRLEQSLRDLGVKPTA